MIALREGDRLTVRDLPPEYRHGLTLVVASTAASTTAPAAAAASTAAETDDGASEGAIEGLTALESAEREVLQQTLKRHQWNMSGVARELNISRNTLYRKLQRLNIQHPEKSLFH